MLFRSHPLKDGHPLCVSQSLSMLHPRLVFTVMDDRKSLPEQAACTARAVNAFSERIRRQLEKHHMNSERIKASLIPANTVLFRGTGQKMSALSFLEMTGLKVCVLAPTKIFAGECLEVRCKLISLIGLGASIGLDIIVASGATGSYDTLLNAKVEAMCRALTTMLSIRSAPCEGRG